MISDYFMKKNEKIKLGWSGQEFDIPKISISPGKTLHKRVKALDRINRILEALNTNELNKLIWLKGYKGKVFYIF